MLSPNSLQKKKKKKKTKKKKEKKDVIIVQKNCLNLHQLYVVSECVKVLQDDNKWICSTGSL